MKWSDMSGLKKNQARRLGQIFGVVFVASGLVTLFSNEPRPTGRWAGLLGPIFDRFGNAGVGGVTIALGIFVFVATTFGNKD